MENKEMNTEKIKFYKKHPVLLAWLISIFIGLGYALFTIIASVIHYEQRDYVWEIIKAFTEMFTWAILMGAVLVFPVVLTISEGICLISEACFITDRELPSLFFSQALYCILSSRCQNWRLP